MNQLTCACNGTVRGPYHSPDACSAAPTAEHRALADVRTLDDWARKQRGHGHETMQIAGGLFLTRLLDAFSLSPTTEGFEGATPDEARAKAAAWVREQAQR
jgi:hypothetical protein